MDEEKIRGLSESVDKLTRTVRSLESRVAALEGGVRAEDHPESIETPDDTDYAPSLPRFGELSATRIGSLLGRSVLILAGAFLLRALTDGGTIPPLVGFFIGLAYSLGLIFLSDRSSHKSDHGGAVVFGITAAMVAFPFLFETIQVLKLVSPLMGGLIVAVISGVALGSAWLRNVRLLAWVYTMASLGTILALGFSAGNQEFFAALLLALGVVTLLMAYTRKWAIKRWVVAVCADVVIYRMTVLVTNPPSVGTGDHGLSPVTVQLLAIALVVIYLGTFTYRALVQGRGVKVFDVIQSVAVLAIGFIGAIRIGEAGAIGDHVLGWLALVAAAGYYAVAFTVVRQRHGRGRGFFYFATLALVFLFLGSRAVADGPWLVWCWITLGVVTAFLGGKFDRGTLRAHSAVYLGLASLQTGMVAAALDTYFASPASVWHGMDLSGLVALLATTGCYWILALMDNTPDSSRMRRLPRFVVALMCLAGFTSLAIVFLVKLVAGTPPDASGPAVAVIRTGILALSALGLAVAGRRKNLVELGWLVYPLLALGLAKLLWEDLRSGNPLALAMSFALFGTAVILAPRILRSGKRSKEEPASD